MNADRARTLTNCGRGCRLACGLLPGLCRTCSSRSTNAALEIRWTICRMLRGLPTGCQPGRCSSAKRTASRIPAAIARTIHRTLRGHEPAAVTVSDYLRTGRGLDAAADIVPDILPDAPRLLRDLLPYIHVRGWCLTKMTGFPIPESRSKSRSLECHGSRTNLQSHRTERAFRNRKRNEAGREWHERTTAKWSAVSGMLVECVTG